MLCLENSHIFSGGVFIAIGLLHIYPEVSNSRISQCVRLYQSLEDRPNIPLPELMFLFGYCLLLIQQKVCCYQVENQFDSQSLEDCEDRDKKNCNNKRKILSIDEKDINQRQENQSSAARNVRSPSAYPETSKDSPEPLTRKVSPEKIFDAQSPK